MDQQFYPRRLADINYQEFKNKFSNRLDEPSLTQIAREGSLNQSRFSKD